jgi:hypothetical protein
MGYVEIILKEKTKKNNKSPKFWLAFALILCIISMLGSIFVQTDGGTVTVKDLRWETPSGKPMSALLFVPGNLILFPRSVLLDRAHFKLTKNPYLGGIIFALWMTIIACTNTLGQLP